MSATTTLETLRAHLQTALVLEHSTVPPYLCALYSIEEGHNTEASALLQSIVMEEMLHMSPAANLLNAIGGRPRAASPEALPVYPGYLPHTGSAFRLVSLEKFSKRSLEGFLRLEMTEGVESSRQPGHCESVGRFYRTIRAGFEHLHEQLGHAGLFTGDPGR